MGQKMTLLRGSLIALSVCGTMALGACSDSAYKNNVLAVDNAAGRYFVLEQVDGTPVKTGTAHPADIMFSAPTEDRIGIFGRICNNFTGQASLSDGVLKAPVLAATLMMCPDDELNKIELQFHQMLKVGAQATLEDGKLVLKTNDHRFVFAPGTKPEK